MAIIINNKDILNNLSTATAIEYPDVIDGYVITTDGVIINDKHPSTDIAIPPIYHSSNGYDFILLMKTDNSFQLFPVDEIVASSFIGMPEGKTSVRHIDGNKRNNNVTNLEWFYEEEEWRTIKDFSDKIRPNYSVSNYGRIRNDTTGKIIKPLNRNGYCSVGIMKNGFQINIHRLVAFAFYGFPNDSKYVVNHIDTNRKNNKLKNLEWVSQYQNNEHAIITGVGHTMKRGSDNILAKISEVEARVVSKTLVEQCRNSRKTYELLNERYPSITLDIVRDINRKRTWRWISKDYF